MSIPREKFVESLTTWCVSDSTTLTTCQIIVPEGENIFQDVRMAVSNASMEPVIVDMNGLHGVDLASAARSPIAVTFKRKVIIVFDYDAIVGNNQPFLTHITSAIKLCIVPVILVMQEIKGKNSVLPIKTVHTITIESPPTPPPPDDEYPIIVKYRKDTFQDKGLEGAIKALEGCTDIEYRGDNIANGGVFDSYLDSAIPGSMIHMVSEAYSWSDIIADSMYGTCDDMYSYVPITTAAHIFSNAGIRGRLKSFGVVWSKNNARYVKMKNIQSITQSVLEENKILMPLLSGLDCFRTMLTVLIHRKEFDRAAELVCDLGLSPPQVLLFMRLWKTKYTLSMHAKIKTSIVQRRGT